MFKVDGWSAVYEMTVKGCMYVGTTILIEHLLKKRFITLFIVSVMAGIKVFIFVTEFICIYVWFLMPVEQYHIMLLLKFRNF